MNLAELFYWITMVLSGYFLILFAIDMVKDLLKGDLMGVFVLIVFAIIVWNVHRWAFVRLVPLQTLF